MAYSSSPNNGRSGGERRGQGRKGWSGKSGRRGGWNSNGRGGGARRDGGGSWSGSRGHGRGEDGGNRRRDGQGSGYRRWDKDRQGNHGDFKRGHRKNFRNDRRHGDRPDRRSDEALADEKVTSAADEPMAPLDFDEKALPASVRAELRGVPADTAHIIEGHLVAAAELLDEDPAQANAHAQAARRHAPRLPVLREVAADTAYQAGEYSSALNDYRALRRMTGNDNFLPVIADCERALGRPQAALRLIREGLEAELSPSQRVELVLVQAGARRDLDQKAEAVRLLRDAVKNLKAPTEATARLHYAYAESLLEDGDTEGARKWFVSARSHDPANFLDCQDRIDILDGKDPSEAPEAADDMVFIETDDGEAQQ